jgi:hypothetical protein
LIASSDDEGRLEEAFSGLTKFWKGEKININLLG